MVQVGINGFGRIGRNIYRASMGNPDFEIVAVNDITEPATLAHLLKYDSTLGQLPMDVRADGDTIHYGDRSIKVFAVRDPAEILLQQLHKHHFRKTF
jgi:glyceraldehyde 3-phosphate dehydrogenase